MKALKLLSLFLLAFFLSDCGTTLPTGPSGPTPSLLEVVNILDTTQTKFLEYADSTNGNPQWAILLTTKWLQSQPNVKSAITSDSTYIDIVMTSGLHTMFYFDEIGANGLTTTRGGGGLKKPPLHSSMTVQKSKNTITNKKVLFFIPPFSQFYGDGSGLQQLVDRVTNSGLGLDVTVLKDGNADWSKVQTFKDYGLVIIDTHGKHEEFLTGSEFFYKKQNGQTLTELDVSISLDAQCGPGTYDKCKANMLTLGTGFEANTTLKFWQKKAHTAFAKIWASSRYLQTLAPMQSTVIFGNFCYSGWNLSTYTSPPTRVQNLDGSISVYPHEPRHYDPIRKAFMDKNPISYYYYGYDNGESEPVACEFAISMEDSLLRSLVIDGDSTGHAFLNQSDHEFTAQQLNLKAVAPDLLFKHAGAVDYSYFDCISEFTDTRDGQKYKAVCIGKQSWMAENLRYNAAGSDVNPMVDPVRYGRHYDHATVMAGAAPSTMNPSGVRGICPKGWHLPSLAEWLQLANSLGGDALAGGPLKATTDWDTPNVGATDKYGFTGLPGGLYYADSSVYYFTGFEGEWWATDDGSTPSRHSGVALVNSEKGLLYGTDANPDPGNKKTCRCLKD